MPDQQKVVHGERTEPF